MTYFKLQKNYNWKIWKKFSSFQNDVCACLISGKTNIEISKAKEVSTYSPILIQNLQNSGIFKGNILLFIRISFNRSRWWHPFVGRHLFPYRNKRKTLHHLSQSSFHYFPPIFPQPAPQSSIFKMKTKWRKSVAFGIIFALPSSSRLFWNTRNQTDHKIGW